MIWLSPDGNGGREESSASGDPSSYHCCCWCPVILSRSIRREESEVVLVTKAGSQTVCLLILARSEAEVRGLHPPPSWQRWPTGALVRGFLVRCSLASFSLPVGAEPMSIAALCETLRVPASIADKVCARSPSSTVTRSTALFGAA